MDRKQKEALMDELLVFMNEEIEGYGNTINIVRFDFNDQGEDAINFANKTGLTYEQLLPVLNTCFSRKYITQKVMGAGKYGMAQLTEEGQGRAISIEAAKHAPQRPENTGTFSIGELHAYGPAQFGNNNTQNIENIFTTMIEKIDQAGGRCQGRCRFLCRVFFEQQLILRRLLEVQGDHLGSCPVPMVA